MWSNHDLESTRLRVDFSQVTADPFKELLRKGGSSCKNTCFRGSTYRADRDGPRPDGNCFTADRATPWIYLR